MSSAVPLLQPELLLTEQATPDMRFAARLISQVQRELTQRNRKMLRITGRWLDLFEYVKMLEEEHLLSSEPLQTQTQFFQGTVALVLGLGTLLMATLQNDDAEQLEALGLTYADLVACVEELSDLHRSMHSDMTNEMIAEMNLRLFSSGQPAR